VLTRVWFLQKNNSPTSQDITITLPLWGNAKSKGLRGSLFAPLSTFVLYDILRPSSRDFYVGEGTKLQRTRQNSFICANAGFSWARLHLRWKIWRNYYVEKEVWTAGFVAEKARSARCMSPSPSQPTQVNELVPDSNQGSRKFIWNRFLIHQSKQHLHWKDSPCFSKNHSH
jgi:hypothetical protein